MLILGYCRIVCVVFYFHPSTSVSPAKNQHKIFSFAVNILGTLIGTIGNRMFVPHILFVSRQIHKGKYPYKHTIVDVCVLCLTR